MTREKQAPRGFGLTFASRPDGYELPGGEHIDFDLPPHNLLDFRGSGDADCGYN